MQQKLNISDLRAAWEQLPTLELEGMLASELEKQRPDDEVVLLLLHILEAREPELPLQLTLREKKAFVHYRNQIRDRRRKIASFPRLLSVAASIVLILSIMIAAIPQQAEANSLWDMLTGWSDKILEFFTSEEKGAQLEYEFQTDHPGLQQVYDTVVEMGVAGPAVPMWIPEGYTLKECKADESRARKTVTATLFNGHDNLVIEVILYTSNMPHEYYKNDPDPEVLEIYGQNYHIVRNLEKWSVVWNRENIECFITLDCQEEELHRILKSIYVMEANE